MTVCYFRLLYVYVFLLISIFAVPRFGNYEDFHKNTWRLVDAQKSPLDTPNTFPDEENDQLLFANNRPEPGDPINTQHEFSVVSPLDEVDEFNKPPGDEGYAEDSEDCSQYCTKDLHEALSTALKPMQSHAERYDSICKSYNDSMACFDMMPCEKSEFATVMTSGIEYLCNQQRDAFTAVMVCIDKQAPVVQSECEQECNTQEVLLNWMMKSGIGKSLMSKNSLLGAFRQAPEGINIGGDEGGILADAGAQLPRHQPLDTNFFRDVSSDMCSVGDCILSCIRKKFNSRCEGSAGSLLSEALVRPIAFGQQKMQPLGPFSGLVGSFLPENCRFLVSGEISKHRISPDLEESLMKMYQKNETSSSEGNGEVKINEENGGLFNGDGTLQVDKLEQQLLARYENYTSLNETEELLPIFIAGNQEANVPLPEHVLRSADDQMDMADHTNKMLDWKQSLMKTSGRAVRKTATANIASSGNDTVFEGSGEPSGEEVSGMAGVGLSSGLEATEGSGWTVEESSGDVVSAAGNWKDQDTHKRIHKEQRVYKYHFKPGNLTIFIRGLDSDSFLACRPIKKRRNGQLRN